MKIIGMTKEELITLDPESINWLLTKEEVIYLARIFGAFWQYNYEAAKEGRLGMHAVLKSELHSDGFFVSRILLEYPNIRRLFANQLVIKFALLDIQNPPDWVAGIPDGATKLGEDVSEIMGIKNAKMKKEESGRIVLESPIGPDETILGIEDFCTRGTGFKEAVSVILSKQPEARFLSYEGVILNRGGLKEIEVEGVGSFQVVPVVEYRITDWDPKECQLCKMGSASIKPKATEENWRLITTSQQ